MRPVTWTNRPLQATYDVAIVGAGVHGLATAYYLGKRQGPQGRAAGKGLYWLRQQ